MHKRLKQKGARKLMSGGEKEEEKEEEEEHLRTIFDEFRTSKISIDDIISRRRRRRQYRRSLNNSESSSVGVSSDKTNTVSLQEIFLQRGEEFNEEDFAKFYHFCFLACLTTQEINPARSISVDDACELWSFLLSSTKKQQLRKSSSSLSIEEGGARTMTTTPTTTTTPSSVLAKGMLLPRWMNRTFCKFCTERTSSSSSSSSSSVVDEETFLRTLDFARLYRKNNGHIREWYENQKWPALIDDFVSSLGRENNTAIKDNSDKRASGGYGGSNDDADRVRTDEELASSSLRADVTLRRGEGGRIGIKTVHPRGQKRKEQEANVDVLSSQLSSALQTKKRKNGGIRLDYFD